MTVKRFATARPMVAALQGQIATLIWTPADWRDNSMAESQATGPTKPWFVGWAIFLKSLELNFDFFGSPLEVLHQMKQANIDPEFAVNHRSTQVKVAKVHKDGRVGHFPGGPNTRGLMELLDAIVIKDWEAARNVLAQYPTLLGTGDETASVPLCVTTATGQSEAVEFLITNGARVDCAGRLGMTPLHWAAVHNEITIAKMLLDAGADRSLQSWFFLTAANLAHANNSIATFRALVPKGVDPENFRVKVSDALKTLGCAPKI
jgi:hypothetical protein